MTYTKKEEMSLVAYAELLESDEQEFEAKNTPSGFTGRASHVRSSPVQSSPVAESWPILCHPMDCSTPGPPVHHPLPELTQTPVHRVSDAIQPSHPLWSPSASWLQYFPASGSFQMSQSFASGDQSIGVSASTSVIPMNTQDWSPLGWTGWISLQSKGLSRLLSPPTPHCKSINSLALSFLYSPTLTSVHDHGKNHSLD